MSFWMVRFVHKIAPSEKDVAGPINIPDAAFDDRNTLGAALRKSKILFAGARVNHFRKEGSKYVVFPNNPGHWHAIVLTPA